MPNNVTDLTQRLLRALDSNYNVTDMPSVIEIISLLEKVSITKELLETTRLGKHVNELRRKTTDDSLSKRAKELVKKWRNMVLPESNGQMKAAAGCGPQEDVNLNQLKTTARKRPGKELMDNVNHKRPKLNGGVSELDFSDNSNSSFKELLHANKAGVILINSDSNSSMPEKMDPHLDQQMPKKRGRKKGSKNHKNLLDEAESSFTNKLAVSRNSKVKTTQELIASLQNKTSNSVLSSKALNKEDLKERAAKLTERVSIIDQKLNTNANRYKNSQKKNRFGAEKNDRVIESGSVINDKNLLNNSEDDIIVVDDVEPKAEDKENHETETGSAAAIPPTEEEEPKNVIRSLSVEECKALMPPIDKSCLLEDQEAICTCTLKENKPDFSVDDDDVNTEHTFEFIEDHECVARDYFRDKYQLGEVSERRLHDLHTKYIPGVNGNYSLGPAKPPAVLNDSGLYDNVVPNVNTEFLPKDVTSAEFDRRTDTTSDTMPVWESGGGGVVESFREWHETVDRPSYNGETLRILPYVIID